MFDGDVTPAFWVGFLTLIGILLALDLFVFHRKPHEVKAGEAFKWVLFWVGLAVVFNVFIHLEFGAARALEFTTGYLIEEALSIDNVFVFLILFRYFHVPKMYQHRVLFFGIVGAIILRGVFILAGSAMLARFHWVIYIFGIFLVFTGIKLLFQDEVHVDPEKNPALRLMRRLVPMTTHYHDKHFFVKEAGKWLATPLFAVLVVVEATDVVFAVDSIPAIFGVTRDPFIVYTSNIFAILGLRALFMLLAGIMDKFKYLKYGLGLVLAFVGVKMLISGWIDIHIVISLGAVILLLGGSIALSFLHQPVSKPSPESHADTQEEEASSTDHTHGD